MVKKSIKIFVLTLMVSFLSFGFTFGMKNVKTPKTLYQVYLDGQKVGVIESKEELLTLIDKEQESLKNKYNVKKVYPPKGLEIRKIVTFNGETQTPSYIYNKIKDEKPFTIKGYLITINKDDDKKVILSVLNKKDFDKAIKSTVEAFVPGETYSKYLDSTQEKITDTGSMIENIDLKEKITYKESYLSTEEEIFTNSDDLTRYLLFGTLDKQKEYVVKSGDLLTDIANKHNLNIEELLIANPDIKSENTLVFPGQKINIGLINPMISVVVTSQVVEEQVVKYKTQETYDNSVLEGYDKVEQEGENGLNRVTYHKEVVNGETTYLVVSSTEQLSPAINKIIRRGGKKVSGTATGNWGWPTISPYVISSRFGYRWGRLHAGIDISGCGHGSPIYAADGGTVTDVSYGNGEQGHYVYINHHNGYYSYYLHLSSIYVKVGQKVNKGQKIAAMGNTGRSTGTHLHFGISRGGKPYSGGTALDPLSFY